MEKLRAIILAVFVVLLSSCGGKVKDISVTSFKIVSIAPQGLSSITALVEIGIHNPTVGFEVTDLHATLKMREQEAVLLSSDQLMVAARCDKTYTVPLKGEIAEGFNPFQLLKLLGNEMDYSQVTISVSARLALRGGMGKTVEVKDIPLSSLINKI